MWQGRKSSPQEKKAALSRAVVRSGAPIGRRPVVVSSGMGVLQEWG